MSIWDFVYYFLFCFLEFYYHLSFVYIRSFPCLFHQIHYSFVSCSWFWRIKFHFFIIRRSFRSHCLILFCCRSYFEVSELGLVLLESSELWKPVEIVRKTNHASSLLLSEFPFEKCVLKFECCLCNIFTMLLTLFRIYMLKGYLLLNFFDIIIKY